MLAGLYEEDECRRSLHRVNGVLDNLAQYLARVSAHNVGISSQNKVIPPNLTHA